MGYKEGKADSKINEGEIHMSPTAWPAGNLSIPKASHQMNNTNSELRLPMAEKDINPNTHIRLWWNTIWIDHFILAADRK